MCVKKLHVQSLQESIPTGMSKADYAEMRFEDALVEDDDFDLLVMGRTQEKAVTVMLMVFFRLSLQNTRIIIRILL